MRSDSVVEDLLVSNALVTVVKAKKDCLKKLPKTI